MASTAILIWQTTRQSALDELESAHAGVGGVDRGRRYATEQINHAYAVLLSAQFQGYCRDLYAECAVRLLDSVPKGLLKQTLRTAFERNLKLSYGNPNPGNIGADFGLFGLEFWLEVKAHDARNRLRSEKLEMLCKWRNAIAHQDFDVSKLKFATLGLNQVRVWRSCCNQLAKSFDEVMRNHLESVNGVSPWRGQFHASQTS